MGCNNCGKYVSDEVYDYCLDHDMPILCRDCQEDYKQGRQRKTNGYQRVELKRKPEPTPQAKKLSVALIKRGIKNELEGYDGAKHVDISISWADLAIEIDGSHHRLDGKQLYTDIARAEYSHEDGVSTIRYSNDQIDKECDKIADAIAIAARKRYRELFSKS